MTLRFYHRLEGCLFDFEIVVNFIHKSNHSTELNIDI